MSRDSSQVFLSSIERGVVGAAILPGRRENPFKEIPFFLGVFFNILKPSLTQERLLSFGSTSDLTCISNPERLSFSCHCLA